MPLSQAKHIDMSMVAMQSACLEWQSGHLVVLSGSMRKSKNAFFGICLKRSTTPDEGASNVQLFATAARSLTPSRACCSTLRSKRSTDQR